MDRLYIVIRSDLEPGAVATQSCHAMSSFADVHPELHRVWHPGGSLVLLSVPDEKALAELVRAARAASIPSAEFYEPDFGNSMTACAFDESAQRMLSSLPLALRAARAA